jgi:hypothetical protein
MSLDLIPNCGKKLDPGGPVFRIRIPIWIRYLLQTDLDADPGSAKTYGMDPTVPEPWHPGSNFLPQLGIRSKVRSVEKKSVSDPPDPHGFGPSGSGFVSQK